MYKKFLSASEGMSMTQVQTLSNLLNQRCEDINATLENINNFSRKVCYQNKELDETQAKPIPSNIHELLLEKGQLHSCQAFLMECVSAKENMLTAAKTAQMPQPTDLIAPERPKVVSPVIIEPVGEEWGFEQLGKDEVALFTLNDTMATHYGKFIHKNSPLDKLRKELPKLKTLDWLEVEKDKKVPVLVNIHHTPEELLAIHTEIATKHREHEKEVNRIKARVKNMVSDKNSEISEANSKLIQEASVKNSEANAAYLAEVAKYNAAFSARLQSFEAEKSRKIKEISALKIQCPSNIQPVIDKYSEIIGTQKRAKTE